MLYSHDFCRSIKLSPFPSALFPSESSLTCLLLQMNKNKKAAVVCGIRKFDLIYKGWPSLITSGNHSVEKYLSGTMH